MARKLLIPALLVSWLGTVDRLPAEGELGRIEKVETRIVFQATNTIALWPSILRLATDELGIAFSGQKVVPDDPWGRVQLITSRDEGIQWSTPTDLFRAPLDVRYPALSINGSGALLLTAYPRADFTTKVKPVWLSQELQAKWEAYKRVTNASRIKTWQHPTAQFLNREGYPTGSKGVTAGFSPHGAVALPDGSFILVGAGHIDGATPALTVERASGDASQWDRIGTVPVPPLDNPGLYIDPHTLRLRDGTLFTVCGYRHPTQPGLNFIRSSYSLDNGLTWSVARSTRIWGSDPNVVELEDGTLAMTYAWREPRFGIRAALSSDGGKSWDRENEVVLAESPTAQVGSPSSVLLRDGVVFTVYHEAIDEQVGPRLVGTAWRVSPSVRGDGN